MKHQRSINDFMCGFGKCVCVCKCVHECQVVTPENGNEHTRKPFFMCPNAENVKTQLYQCI